MSDEEILVGTYAGAISLIGHEDVLARSVEVARLWVEDGGGGTFIINPYRLLGPEMFGMMIADCVRHAARAFAHASEMRESEALERIWEGLDAERDTPSAEPETIDPGGRLQ